LSEKLKLELKKRGFKLKLKREQWLKENYEKESNLFIYEKKIEGQLNLPLDELLSEVSESLKFGELKMGC